MISEEEFLQREKLVIGEYAGILPYNEVFYIHSILFSASRAVSSFRAAEHFWAQHASTFDVFAYVQEALIHVAGLSRFFWPSKGGLAKARGGSLREAFNLKDDSPLKVRSLRNALEHYDEDLDRYLLTDPVGERFPDPVVTNVEVSAAHPQHMFKLLDIERKVCVILGREYEYGGMEDEVTRVFERALQMHANGGRL